LNFDFSSFNLVAARNVEGENETKPTPLSPKSQNSRCDPNPDFFPSLADASGYDVIVDESIGCFVTWATAPLVCSQVSIRSPSFSAAELA